MEKRGRYVNEGFREGGEDTGEGFDESDFEFIGDFYVNKKFCREMYQGTISQGLL